MYIVYILLHKYRTQSVAHPEKTEGAVTGSVRVIVTVGGGRRQSVEIVGQLGASLVTSAQ
jgi:hypothetical protein